MGRGFKSPRGHQKKDSRKAVFFLWPHSPPAALRLPPRGLLEEDLQTSSVVFDSDSSRLCVAIIRVCFLLKEGAKYVISNEKSTFLC